MKKQAKPRSRRVETCDISLEIMPQQCQFWVLLWIHHLFVPISVSKLHPCKYLFTLLPNIMFTSGIYTHGSKHRNDVLTGSWRSQLTNVEYNYSLGSLVGIYATEKIYLIFQWKLAGNSFREHFWNFLLWYHFHTLFITS